MPARLAVELGAELPQQIDIPAGIPGLLGDGEETRRPRIVGLMDRMAEARIPKAADAVRSALEMADLFARLRASSRA